MSVVKPFNIPAISPGSLQSIPCTVGSIVEVTEQGVALVDFPENTGAPVRARSILSETDKIELTRLPVDVLLVFDQSDPLKPIITGFINESLFTPQQNVRHPHAEQDGIIVSPAGKSIDTRVDGQKVTFDAKEEILLRCGKSSILLRKDGKIVIKGANLLSRSSSSNKIKGSSVSIN